MIAAASVGGFGDLCLPRSAIDLDPEAFRRLKEAVGGALMRWQHVEAAMFYIAHGIMGPDYAVNSIVFFHVKSAESKLALLDKLMMRHLSQKAYGGAWKPLRNTIGNMIEMRNALAHFEGYAVPQKHREAHNSAFPVGLASHHLDAHAGRSGYVKSLRVEDIERISQELLSTTGELLLFARQYIPEIAAKLDGLPPQARAWWLGEQ